MGTRVLVTGATGHLGFNLVRDLASHGYEVRAGVRDHSDLVRTAPLRDLGVEVVTAHLERPETLARAARDVDGIFHTAAVLQFWAENPQREIIDPTVSGAVGILEAGLRAGVRRVVFTSSLAAIGISGPQCRTLTEADWNEDPLTAYSVAKTRAERRAWQFAEEHDLDLVVVNPASIIGPGVFRHTPVTRLVEYVIRGRLPFVLPADTSYVDARDVAAAQRAAFERPEAAGRYLLATAMVPMREFVRMLVEFAPGVRAPRWVLPVPLLPPLVMADAVAHRLFGTERQLTQEMIEEFAGSQLPCDTTKSQRELDWRPRAIRQSVADTVDWVRKQFIDELS